MNFKQKVLSKSDSYNYYKKQTEKLEKENESLKKELEEVKSKNPPTLKETYYNQFSRHLGFCNYGYVNYFLEDNFEDNLKEVTKHLDSESKYYFKWLYLRNMVSGVVARESLYSNSELANQKRYIEFRDNNTSPNNVAGFEFTGKYNLHPFVDLNLDDEDKEFLKNKDIIDAGAFTGDTSLPLANLTERNIYAFEPFEDSFRLLEKNIKDNNLTNIIPIKKSLGNTVGEKSLYLSGNNIQGITTNPNARRYDQEFRIQETTIDTFVSENDLEVGYINVDVEGAEMELLNGAINTIKTQKPILCISIYHKLSDFFGIIPWIANLNLGYEFEIVKENPWFFFADTSVKCRVKNK